jgi:hypothetical protein
MTAIVTSNFRVVNAENFKQDVADANTSVYVGIGKSDVWSLTTSDTTDTTPFAPVDALDSLGEAYQNLIGMKLIGSADISHVVPRYTWSNTESYYAWDSDDGSIFDKKFYIVTSEFKVYKCIKAGGSTSTVQPTQTLTDPTAESDGYIWKYMYTISVADAEKFLTTSYMPVKTVSPRAGGQASDFLSDGTAEAALSEADYAQYLNQKASTQSATAAGIERVDVTIGGTYSSTPTVSISGDGVGATATAVMSGSGSTQTVDSITITNKGTNYTVADITFGSGDAGARAVIAPELGHGTQPIKELGAFFIGLNSQLSGTEGGDLTVGNDFRQVTLIRNPRLYGPGAIATANTLKGLRALDFTSGVTVTDYLVDELIVGQTTGAQAYVVEIDASTGYIYYHQNSKTGYTPFNNSETITGQTSNTAGALEGTSAALRDPEVHPGTGDIMFLENRNPINRTTTQIEDIKVIIEF